MDNALAIMTPESHGDPSAFNTNYDKYGNVSSHDYGLFQINSIHSARVGGNLTALYDPTTNVRVAFAIYSEQGWCPWATARGVGLCR